MFITLFSRAIYVLPMKFGAVFPKTKLDTFQRLQDRARSIVENARYKDNWSCDWLSVENIIRFDRSVMTYKIRNKLSPESLWDKFQQRSSQSNYATRNCRDLQIPRLNTEHAKKSYRYSAIKVWNEIPVAVRELPTISLFKKRTKGVLEELTENTNLIKNTTPWKNSILG